MSTVVDGSSIRFNACLRRRPNVPVRRHVRRFGPSQSHPRDLAFFVVSAVAYRHSCAAYQCPKPIAVIGRARALVAARRSHPPEQSARGLLIANPSRRNSYPPVIHRGPRAGGGRTKVTRKTLAIRRTILPGSQASSSAPPRPSRWLQHSCYASLTLRQTLARPARCCANDRRSYVADSSTVPAKITCLHPISSPRWLIFFKHAHFARWHRQNMNKHPKWPLTTGRE
jgi:hypothetical protein